MSVFNEIQIENQELKEAIMDVQMDLQLLTDYLRYGPELVSRAEVIMRIGFIDLPPSD